MDKDIREAKKNSKLAPTLAEKLEFQKQIKQLDQTRTKKRKELFEEQDKVDAQRDGLIDELEGRLKQRTKVEAMFTIRWRIR